MSQHTPTLQDLEETAVFSGLTDLQNYIHGAARSRGFHDATDRLQQAQDLVELLPVTDDVKDLLATVLEDARRDKVGNRLMLIVGEIAEGHEEIRKGHAPDEEYFSFSPPPTSFAVEFASGQDATNAWEARVREQGQAKPEGLPSELADVVIRAFDQAGEEGIDLGHVIQQKLRYNETRARMHGGKKF